MERFTVVDNYLLRDGLPQECPQGRGSAHGHTSQCGVRCPHFAIESETRGGKTTYHAALYCNGPGHKIELDAVPS
jgi:hypothetical protein